MTNSKEQIVLRGFAFRSNKDNKYYAFCVDLNLADQGESFEEVMKKMYDNITLYVESELKYNQIHNIDTFPYRKAPLGIMLRYQYVSLGFRISFVIRSIKEQYKKCNSIFNLKTHTLSMDQA